MVMIIDLQPLVIIKRIIASIQITLSILRSCHKSNSFKQIVLINLELKKRRSVIIAISSPMSLRKPNNHEAKRAILRTIARKKTDTALQLTNYKTPIISLKMIPILETGEYPKQSSIIQRIRNKTCCYS